MSDREKKQAREAYLNKTFRLMWHLLFIFGVPAALAVLMGRWAEKRFEMEPTVTFVLLLIAFVSSWVVVIFKYRALEKERKALEGKRKNER